MLAAGPTLADGVEHHVSVGGPDQDVSDHGDANFSLVAIQHGNGTVTGEWTDQFGQGQGGIHVRVDCVFVQGNEAWVSGIITSGTVAGQPAAFQPVVTRVRDNGKSANDPPDEISASFIGDNTPCTFAPDFALHPLTHGQVTVD
jgi:hypothetical protein